MSKWTEAKEYVDKILKLCSQDVCKRVEHDCKYCFSKYEIILEALDISDRLESADNTPNGFIYEKGCINCIDDIDNCPHKARGRYCNDINWYFEGYQQALNDMKKKGGGAMSRCKLITCDICGKHFGKYRNRQAKIKVRNEDYVRYDDWENRKWIKVDLCPKCNNNLTDYLVAMASVRNISKEG